jgi:hypothetical protein
MHLAPFSLTKSIPFVVVEALRESMRLREGTNFDVYFYFYLLFLFLFFYMQTVYHWCSCLYTILFVWLQHSSDMM